MLDALVRRRRGDPRGAGGAVAEPRHPSDLGRRRHRRHARRLLGRGPASTCSSSTRYASMSRHAARPGFRIEGPVETFTQVVPAMTPEEVDGPVRPHRPRGEGAPHRRRRSPPCAPHLADDGYVLSAQNGLNEIAHRRTIGEAAHDGLLRQFRRRLARAGPHPLRQPRRGRRRRDRRRESATRTRAHARASAGSSSPTRC